MFLGLAFLLRSSSFFQTAMGPDEGLYLLMADRWLAGEGLYTTVWDNKPPGIYALFAASQLLFGHSVLAVRISSLLAVASSCYLLYRLGSRLGGQRIVGALAGLCYATFSVAYGALPANTEIFFTPFVVGAFSLLLSDEPTRRIWWSAPPLRLLGAGLLLGVAFEIKYVVVFDFVALLLIAILAAWRRGAEATLRRRRLGSLTTVLLLSVGFLLPFLLVTTSFWLGGRFPDYAYSNFTANLINSADTPFSPALFLQVMRDQVLRSLPLWVCLMLAPVYLLVFRDTSARDRRNILALLTWFGFAFVGVSFTKLFFRHYFLQVLPPLCLLTALLVWFAVSDDRIAGRRRAFLIALTVGVPLVLSSLVPLGWGSFYAYHRWIRGDRYWGDEAGEVSEYLKRQVDPGEAIFAGDFSPVLYYELGIRPPTRYAFPLMLTEPHFARVAGIDPDRELADVMAKRPRFVVRQWEMDTPFYRKLADYLARDYEHARSVNWIDLYRRR